MAQDTNQKGGSGSSRHVRDVMTANPECVGERDSLRDVARIMKDKDTGVVPVVDGKKIIGLITDRDIVVRGLAEGKNLETSKVTDVMTRTVRSVREDSSVNDALALMSNAEIRRVPVVDESGCCTGIISQADIAWTEQPREVAELVREVSRDSTLPSR